MSEGDHESWDDEMMMSENNETPLPVVSLSFPSPSLLAIYTHLLIVLRNLDYTTTSFDPYDYFIFAAVLHVQGRQHRSGQERYVLALNSTGTEFHGS
jgi:hypothetical protein